MQSLSGMIVPTILLFFVYNIQAATETWLWVANRNDDGVPLRIFILGTLPATAPQNINVKELVIDSSAKVVPLWQQPALDFFSLLPKCNPSDKDTLSTEQADQVLNAIEAGCGEQASANTESMQGLPPVVSAWLISRCFGEADESSLIREVLRNVPQDRRAQPVVTNEDICQLSKDISQKNQLQQLADALKVAGTWAGVDAEEMKDELSSAFKKGDSPFTHERVPALTTPKMFELIANKLQEAPEDSIVLMPMPYVHGVQHVKGSGWTFKALENYEITEDDLSKPATSPPPQDTADANKKPEVEDSESITKEGHDTNAIVEGDDVLGRLKNPIKPPYTRVSKPSVQTIAIVAMTAVLAIVLFMIARLYIHNKRSIPIEVHEMHDMEDPESDNDSLFDAALEENEAIQGLEDVNLQDELDLTPSNLSKRKGKAD